MKHSFFPTWNRLQKAWPLYLGMTLTLSTVGISIFSEGNEGEPRVLVIPADTSVPSAPLPISPQVAQSYQAPDRGEDSIDFSAQKPLSQPDASKASESLRPASNFGSATSKNTNLNVEKSRNKTKGSQSKAMRLPAGSNQPRQKRKSLGRTERLTLGRSLVAKRLYQQASEVLRPLFDSPPEDWEPWFWMGSTKMGLGDYEEARDYLREGLARDETIPELWVQCALVEHQRGKYISALDYLRQAELLDPTLPQVHLNLAYTLETQGNLTTALNHYRQYLSTTKNNPRHFSTRKKVLNRILHLARSLEKT